MVEKLTVSAVIPCFRPDDRLEEVVRGLVGAGFSDIIIVNDGSPAECDRFFAFTELYPQVTLLQHFVNRGKGAALKTAFTYFLQYRGKDYSGVVTVNADGYHTPRDVYRCARTMQQRRDQIVLCSRDYTNMPRKLRRGNAVASFILRTGCGIRVSDTQSGLRAIPREYLVNFLRTRGNRFDYESNMLIDIAVYSLPFTEITAKAHPGSALHRIAFRDILKVYYQIIKFSLSSLACWTFEYLLYDLLILLLAGSVSVRLIYYAARVVALSVNFCVNRRVVFRARRNIRRTALRYVAIQLPIMLISAEAVNGLASLIPSSGKIAPMLVKIPVDTAMFILSYSLQREWVFRDDKNGDRN